MRPIERFWAKVSVGVCWEWTAYRLPSGYGQFRYEGRTQRAHRVAWLMLVGDIPADLELDHLCHNRGCVNPDHMELVTHAVNTRRRRVTVVVAAERNAAKSECIRGHPFDDVNTYRPPGRTTKRSCRACRRESARVRRRKDEYGTAH